MKQKRLTTRWACLLLLLMLLAACGSKKQVATPVEAPRVDAATGMISLDRIVEAANAGRTDITSATARMTFSLRSNDRNVSLGGTLRMKRDEVIQLSLYALGIMEVGRMEITPDYFMVIDKVGRQYMKASFADVPFLSTAGVNFRTLQALFRGELFLLSDKAPADRLFTKTLDGTMAKLVNADSRLAVLTFMVDAVTALNRQTIVSPSKTSDATPYFQWEYSEYRQLGSKQFPVRHLITVNSGTKPVSVGITLSGLKNEQGWATRTEVPKQNYTEVSIDKVLQRLMSISR